jgi:hypothetical protein
LRVDGRHGHDGHRESRGRVGLCCARAALGTASCREPIDAVIDRYGGQTDAPLVPQLLVRTVDALVRLVVDDAPFAWFRAI